jgi:hypothetical protein
MRSIYTGIFPVIITATFRVSLLTFEYEDLDRSHMQAPRATLWEDIEILIIKKMNSNCLDLASISGFGA